MFQTLRNAWKVTDIRKKILYTLFIILIFRIGSAIPVPFVDLVHLKEMVSNDADNTAMQLLTLMSGGGFSDASILALSITPYINASIIIQLLTVAIPALERMAQNGEEGRKKLGQITRYVTVILGLMLGVAYYFMVKNKYGAIAPCATGGFDGFFCGVVIVLCFTAGSALMMWLGEQINERGIGNGISILLFAGILSRLPNGVQLLYDLVSNGVQSINSGNGDGVKWIVYALAILVLVLAIIVLIVFISNAERRIPIQYAKRTVGRKIYGGQNTFIPIKVNMSGVMPIILAVSIVSMPSILQQFFGWKDNWFLSAFHSNSWVYVLLYFLLIIGFAFFYVTIQYNPVEMANNLRKNSGAIPGYRPGKPTVDYIRKVISKITLIGALFLGVIALTPSIFGIFTKIGLGLGGTSVMIVVGVALETMQQIESQIMMRHYKGFLE